MKNKIILSLSLLFILALAALIILTARGNKEVTDAYITNSNLPRTNYVAGQELDLSSGYLTVIRGGEEANIPFTADGVTVSGYDKDTVGEQTLTVSYETVSTTFTINVIPRIVAENFETKYFVGDSFDKSKGRLRIAQDDGKTVNVNLSDSKVSVLSFDSEAPGKKTVTVRYKNGEISYDCQFDVTVYEASNIVYTAPKKTDYDSHKTEIEDKDVKDGFFTVTSSDGLLTKIVPITADMVKGYNPSAATIENREIALEQMLKIEYLGKSFDYKISIYFSGISIINHYANGILNGLDLSGELSNDEKLAALDAITELLDLSLADRSTIPQQTVTTVVSAAAVGVTDLFMKELDNHKYAFAMDDNGQLLLVGKTYTATDNALDKLTDEASELNRYVSVLRQLVADFGTTRVTATETVSDIVIVYSEDMENLLIPVLKHLVTVHELLDDVDKNWTVDTLEQYGTNIIDAVIEIKRSEYYQNGFGAFYTDVLSSWRDKNDLLEIIYSFFLYVYDGDESFMQTNLFGQFPMPGTLENLYESIMTTYNMQVTYYQNQQGDMWLADLSRYATSYFLTLDYAEEVKASGNQFWIDIYNKYNLDYVIATYTSGQYFGFAYHTGAMADSDTYNTLWKQYYGVLQYYLTDNLKASTHKQLICAMFDTFQSMTPNEVFGFLSSLNLNYGDARGTTSVMYLDFEEKQEANIFATILREYYCEYLTEANVPIFSNLLMAIESAALFGENDEVLNNFVYYMEAVKNGYTNLKSNEDIENFNTYLGKSYFKYLDMYKRILGEELEEKPTADELALIEKLKEDIGKYEDIYLYLSNLAQADITNVHYILLYSAFAQATESYNSIINGASDAALTVLFTEGYEFLGRIVTVGKAYYHIDKQTTLMMLSATAITADGKLIYVTHMDGLTNYGLLTIYADMRDLLYFALVDNTAIPDSDVLDDVKANIEQLSRVGSTVFSEFGGASAYYSAKCAYLAHILKNEASALAVANALSEAAVCYENYLDYPGNTEYKSEFISAMAEIVTSYEALSDEHKNALSEVYSFYLAAYGELSPQA